jgi:transposase
MISFTGSLKVFIALEPIDMRKGFEGLYGAVSEQLKEDVKSGALFAFCLVAASRLPRPTGSLQLATSLRSVQIKNTRGSKSSTGIRRACG